MSRSTTEFRRSEPTYETFQNEEDENGTNNNPKSFSEQGYTVTEAVEALGFGKFQVLIGLMVGLAWLADGMEIMVLSILGPVLMCEWELHTWQEAMLTTVVFIGFLIGSPVFGYLADKYGRRKSLMMSAVWISYYGCMSALAPSLAWLLILRLMVGFGVAGGQQSMTYFSEYVRSTHRGRCIILVEVFFAAGGMLGVIFAILVLQPFGWRWWLVCSAIPSAVFLILSFFMPESVRYEVASGHPERAEAILVRAAKMNRVSLPAGRVMQERRVPRGRFKDLVSSEFRNSSALLAFIWFTASFCYYGIVLFTTELVKNGSTCTDSVEIERDVVSMCSMKCESLSIEDYMALLWTSAAELPGLFLTAILVDALGRKKTMALNFSIFCVVCFSLYICMRRIPMLAILFSGRAIIASAFQTLFVYTPEVYPTQIRAISVGMGSTFGRAGALITPYIAEVLLARSLYTALSVYGVMGLLGAVAAMLLPLETKGHNLKG